MAPRLLNTDVNMHILQPALMQAAGGRHGVREKH